MKHIKRALLFILAALLFCFMLSCGGKTEPPKGENGDIPPETENTVDLIAEGYAFVNNRAKLNEREPLKQLIEDIKKETGHELSSIGDDKDDQPEKKILFGTLRNNVKVNSARNALSSAKGQDMHAFSLFFDGEDLIIYATSNTGLYLASEKLLSYAEDGKLLIPKDLSEKYIYSEEFRDGDGDIVLFPISERESNAYLSSIYVEGIKIEGFDYKTGEYTAYYSATEDYPRITSAIPVAQGASVSISQPTEEAGGAATVTVTSKDGTASSSYTVKFEYGENVKIRSEIVNKDNTGGVVSFVFDDGIQKTADLIETNLLPKYKSIRLSHAIVTNKLCALSLSPDGTQWETDMEGNYLYEPLPDYYKSEIEGSRYSEGFEYRYEFWKAISEHEGVELLSHSHTHADWGTSDRISYDPETGDILFPAGNVTKELLASAQILRNLLGEEALCYIKPGVGACAQEKYYLDLIQSSGIYIGARTTTKKVNFAPELSNADRRFNVYSLAVQHYATKQDENGDYTTEYGCGIDAALAAGIPIWTDYIDSAISKGGWACFCIHNVVPDTEISNAKHYIFESQLDMLFAHSENRSDEGSLWIATYTEAQKYYNEWAAAEIETIVKKDESVTVRVTDGLDNEIYDMPLTVKVYVPKSWQTAKTDCNGSVTELTVYGTEEGTPYVFVNVIPDSADVVITK